MATTVNATLRHKRGTEESIPTLKDGQIYLCSDTHKIYKGTSEGRNVLIGDINELNKKATKEETLQYKNYNSVDLNTLINTGTCGYCSSCSNIPAHVTDGYIFILKSEYNNITKQLYFPFHYNGFFVRSLTNDGWSEWSEVSQTKTVQLPASSFLNGWISRGNNTGLLPTFTKSGKLCNLTCQLEITTGTIFFSGVVPFNIPEGFRPINITETMTLTQGGGKSLSYDITPDGNVRLWVGSNMAIGDIIMLNITYAIA